MYIFIIRVVTDSFAMYVVGCSEFNSESIKRVAGTVKSTVTAIFSSNCQKGVKLKDPHVTWHVLSWIELDRREQLNKNPPNKMPTLILKVPQRDGYHLLWAGSKCYSFVAT